jgi:hypothetical protein
VGYGGAGATLGADLGTVENGDRSAFAPPRRLPLGTPFGVRSQGLERSGPTATPGPPSLCGLVVKESSDPRRGRLAQRPRSSPQR